MATKRSAVTAARTPKTRKPKGKQAFRKEAPKSPESSPVPNLSPPEVLVEEVAHVHDARHPAGRPTEYRPEYCDLAKRLCESGATDQELADVLRIHRATLYRWLGEYPRFRDAVRLGKEPADDRVERSLFHRAVGYTHEALKIMQEKGTPVVVRYMEHVPPDPGAAFNWLKNRRPDQWRDRRELTGADGQPIELKTSIEFVDAPAQSGAVPT